MLTTTAQHPRNRLYQSRYWGNHGAGGLHAGDSCQILLGGAQIIFGRISFVLAV